MSRADLLGAHAHRWPGFDDAEIAGWLGATGCVPARSLTIAGALPVRLWVAERKTHPEAVLTA